MHLLTRIHGIIKDMASDSPRGNTRPINGDLQYQILGATSVCTSSPAVLYMMSTLRPLSLASSLGVSSQPKIVTEPSTPGSEKSYDDGNNSLYPSLIALQS